MSEAVDSYPTAYSYRKLALISKDYCSTVYRAIIINSTMPAPPPQFVALKELSLSETKKIEREFFRKEIRVMKKLIHENCVRFHQAILEPGTDKAWIVMELADCGDLTDLISRVSLREDHIAAFCKEVSGCK
jgi:serine/threonine protein kinase